MTTNDTYDLLSLLATTSYTLAYALPLFLVSLVLTVAGCFLTLDRTRVFAPAQARQAPPAHRSILSHLHPLYLQGGIGGLCAGYAFGVHFSTFLSVVLPNVTSTSPLGHKAFLAVWVISALFSLLLGGKSKYGAFSLIGISGYCTLALAISVIVHPPLLSRIVLASVVTPLGTIFSLLPFPRSARIALRIGASSVGAFGTIVSIALFCRNPTWGNIWDRFWMHDGVAWGSSAERGLSAGFCFLFLVGIVCDYFLHLKIGENPDEKWDRYLADYTNELPNDSRRAGSYAPAVSFWDRLLGRHGPFAPIVPHHDPDRDILFPTDADIKLPVPSPPIQASPTKLTKDVPEFPEIPDSKLRLAVLRKKASRRTITHAQRTTRPAIKFRPHSSSSSSDSDSEHEEQGSALNAPAPSRTDSSTTLVDSRGNLDAPKRPWNVPPDYSDGEDITSVGRRPRAEQWPPEFIRRSSVRRASPPSRKGSLPVAEDALRTPSSSQPALAPPVAGLSVPSVPATPSLIRAVERIQLAHAQDPASIPPVSSSPSPSQDPAHRRGSWDAFWSDVKTKAHY